MLLLDGHVPPWQMDDFTPGELDDLIDEIDRRDSLGA